LIAKVDSPPADVHVLVRFEPGPEGVIKIENFGFRVNWENQELH
jgi:hypothetical protein